MQYLNMGAYWIMSKFDFNVWVMVGNLFIRSSISYPFVCCLVQDYRVLCIAVRREFGKSLTGLSKLDFVACLAWWIWFANSVLTVILYSWQTFVSDKTSSREVRNVVGRCVCVCRWGNTLQGFSHRSLLLKTKIYDMHICIYIEREKNMCMFSHVSPYDIIMVILCVNY